MRTRLTPLLVGLILLLAACSSGGGASASAAASAAAPSTAAVDITIFGAASLSGALAEVKNVYEAANPGVTLTISTDSSAALETKIEQGAPADVFLSADTTNPKKLVDKGLTTGPAVNFADNKLTVIVPIGNPGKVMTPK